MIRLIHSGINNINRSTKEEIKNIKNINNIKRLIKQEIKNISK